MADLQEMPEAELRGRVRKLLAEVHPERTDSITFRRKQFEHGFAWVHLPEGHGGRELAIDVLGGDGLAFEAGYELRQSGFESRVAWKDVPRS